ncbi:MAG: hypothetical protein AAB483_02230 [Patescibacteria group bacterium]
MPKQPLSVGVIELPPDPPATAVAETPQPPGGGGHGESPTWQIKHGDLPDEIEAELLEVVDLIRAGGSHIGARQFLDRHPEWRDRLIVDLALLGLALEA